ncbi:MAG: T9SS type A sorting domain-containing protein, partial [Candidatus Cloacimonetes bacterium]|nr:T9SS type A sorting domain-containing protein [Candidatus Cloacimonadota bacterium]
IGDCYLTTITNTYSTSVVTGNSEVGRFAGRVVDSYLINSVWEVILSEEMEGIGLEVGVNEIVIYEKTASEMRQMATYTDLGWDFVDEIVNGEEDIWILNSNSNDGYPYINPEYAYVGNEEETNITPQLQTKLYNNYPNPFNPETTISFSVKKNDVTSLKIYNIKGQVVKSYPKFTSGEHKVVWKGVDKKNKPVASGVYFYRLESKTGSMTKKMMLMK